MYVCFVKHSGDDKSYLFDCTDVHDKIACHDKVICETMRGVKDGIISTCPVEISGKFPNCGVDELLCATGAYLPLKKVLRKFSPLQFSQAEKDEIIREWLWKQLHEDVLPF